MTATDEARRLDREVGRPWGATQGLPSATLVDGSVSSVYG